MPRRLIRTIIVMVMAVLLIGGCRLPLTHVHPDFGPTYGGAG